MSESEPVKCCVLTVLCLPTRRCEKVQEHRKSHWLIYTPPLAGIQKAAPQLFLVPSSPSQSLTHCSLHFNHHHANLRKDPHRKDYHPRGGVFRHHRQRKGEDPGQGRVSPLFTPRTNLLIRVQHSPRSTTPDFCWQAARGW